MARYFSGWSRDQVFGTDRATACGTGVGITPEACWIDYAWRGSIFTRSNFRVSREAGTPERQSYNELAAAFDRATRLKDYTLGLEPIDAYRQRVMVYSKRADAEGLFTPSDAQWRDAVAVVAGIPGIREAYAPTPDEWLAFYDEAGYLRGELPADVPVSGPAIEETTPDDDSGAGADTSTGASGDASNKVPTWAWVAGGALAVAAVVMLTSRKR